MLSRIRRREKGRVSTDGRLNYRINQELTKRGLKQYELAKIAGLANTTINRILTGDLAVSKEAAEKIAVALDWDIEETVRHAFIENEIAQLYERFSEYPTIIRMLDRLNQSRISEI